MSFVSLDINVTILYPPQLHPGLSVMQLVRTGVSVFCNHGVSCLRGHREYRNIQILQAKKKLSTVLSKRFLYRLPIFLPFVFAFL